MIAAWMLYALLTSLLVTAAAVAGEHCLRRLGRPVRLVWVAALVGSTAVVAVAWTSVVGTPDPGPRAALAAAPLPGLVPTLPELTLTPSAGLDRLDRPLLVLWALGSLLTGGVLLGAALGTARDRRRWRRASVDGHDVLVSDDFGPAVVGVTRPAVVVPSWVLGLGPEPRALVLQHEEEHRRTGDVALLVVAAWVAAFVPWNIAVWIQLRRLRTAVELDCDRRVLRRGAPPLRYANLLLRVGEGRAALLTPALAEPASTLERRIRMITERRTSRTRWTALGTAAAGVLLLAAACEVPKPTAVVEEGEEAVEAGAEQTLTADGSIVLRSGEGEDRPLFIVDGSVVSSVDGIPPETIVTVEVLKGAAATGRYGERGRNGVVLVTTRAAGTEASSEAEPPRRPDAPVEPSPQRSDVELSEAPTFTPYTVAPDITNRSEVVRALREGYPRLLREAGVGGTTLVHFFIDETGTVTDTRINQTSGHDALDRAALSVASTMEFTPARNRDEAVPVWITLPITFTEN